MHRCCPLWQLLSFWLWLHCVQSKTSMFAQLTMSFTMLRSWASRESLYLPFFLRHAHALEHNAQINRSMCLLPQILCHRSHVFVTTKVQAVCCCLHTCNFCFILVHQCAKFHCERTHHKQVIGTNTVYTSLYCLRLFVAVYKLVMLILMMGWIVLSLWVLGLTSCHTLLVSIIMYGLGNFFLFFTCKQHCLQANQNALARPVMDSNLCAKFQLYLTWFLRYTCLNWTTTTKTTRIFWKQTLSITDYAI